MSCVFAAQGVIIIGLGISCPWVVVDLSWRWMYFITAGFAGLFLGGCVFFLPETKWHRTKAEMSMSPTSAPLAPRQLTSSADGIPKRENTSHSPRTFAYDIAFFHNSPEWRKGWQSFLDTICTFFYPQILFITLLNSAMIAATFAAGYTVAPALLTKPWS
jgi:MFS family permease